MIGLILLIVLLVILFGGSAWGYRGGAFAARPAPYLGGLVAIIILLIVVFLLFHPFAYPVR